MEHKAPQSRARTLITEPLVACLVLLLLTLSANFWTLDSPYRADDFHILRQSGPWLSELADRALALKPTQTITTMHRGNFRPVVWGLTCLEWRFFDGPHPRLAHGLSLLLHSAVNLCLFFLVRRLAGIRAAWIAGILFALHPAGIQAVTWTAARADILVGLFCVLSVLAALRSSKAWWAVSGLFAALALGSKASAIVALPMILFVTLLQAGKNRRWAALLWSTPVALMFFLRWIWLGTWGPWFYMSDSGKSRGIIESLTNGLHLVQIVTDMLVPWTRETSTPSWLASVLSENNQVVLTLAFLLPLLLAVVLRTHRRLLALGFVTFLLLLIPLQSIWTDRFFGQFQNRNYYLPFLVMALLVGTASSVLWTGDRTRRLLSLVFGMVIALVSVDALISFARVENEATRKINTIRAVVNEAAATLPADTDVLVIDPEEFHGGQYLLGSGITSQFSPPFSATSVNVFHADGGEAFLRDMLQCHTRGLQVIDARRESTDLSASPLVLAPPPPSSQSLPRQEDRGKSITFRPLARIPGRSCAVFLITVGPGSRTELQFEAFFEERQFTCRRWLPATERPQSIVVMDLPTDALLTREFTEARVTFPSSPARRVDELVVPGRPDIIDRVTGRRTADGFLVSGATPGDMVRVVTRGQGGSQKLQINLDWRREAVSLNSDGFRLEAGNVDSSRPFVPLDSLKAAIRRHDRDGVFWRVESYALHGDSWISPWFDAATKK